jgi:signal peptidase I
VLHEAADNITDSAGARPGALVVRAWWARLLIGRRPVVTLIRLVVLVAACGFLFKVVLVPIRVTGRSMEPTYRNGRVNFLQRHAYRRRDPARGDVVGLQLEGSRLVLLKRIVGLPGERVGLRGGRVFINGEPLAEPYTRGHEVPSTRGERTLGVDEYFVIGDNRDESAHGVVRRAELRGKVLW